MGMANRDTYRRVTRDTSPDRLFVRGDRTTLNLDKSLRVNAAAFKAIAAD
jgi:hypothetical protein